MKKLLVLLALCMVLSVVLVACQDPDQPTEDTTAGSTEAPTTEAPTTEAPTTEEPTTEAPTTDTTDAPTTEPPTTEPPAPPADPVTIHISKDEIRYMVGEGQVGQAYAPGAFDSWADKIATVEDYNVDAIVIWGWAGFFAENIGEFGYQIDDNDAVFADFTFSTEQGVIDAAAAGGAKSASRFYIPVPVLYLNGEHTIKALVRDAAGTVEVFHEFTLNKAENPNAPVAFIPAADMASSIPGSPGVNGAELSADGKYVTIDTINQGDPYYQLPMMNGKGTVGAFVAIKYRTTSTFTASEVFVGSGAGPNGQGDNIRFELTCDGKWNLAIVDLAQASAVVDGVINYLRWDPFAGAATATIDMAYIGVFQSAEAALAYDAQFKGDFIDTLNVPTSAWTVTGHCQGVVPAEGHGNSGMVAAGGVAEGALLHQGYIYLGDINLAEMSKVVIYYGVDGSQTTIDLHAASANNRILLTSADQAMTNSPTEDVILAANTYTELGWAVKPLEIDLTGVDYNGPVYVTYDTLPGTFFLISSVEFTYDPDYVAPVQPENGSLELPLTVGQTLSAVAGLEEGAATDIQYYTTGVVTEIGQTGSYYKNVYFTDGENTMLIYTLNPMEGMPELQVGDTITVFGYIKNYGGTIEFASKNVDDAQVYVYIVAHESAPVEEAPKFEGNWHASVDSFMYCVQDDFSDVVTFAGANTNSTIGTTITNASGTLPTVTAKYVYFAGGWLAVDGYSLENWVCNIYAADGTLLNSVALGLKVAEEGVVNHVANNMHYAGVPNRVGNETEIINLGEYAGQTVTVVYTVDAVDTDYTIELIRIDVTVPAAAEEPELTPVPPMWNANLDLITHQSFDQLYKGDAAATNGPENIFTPGQAAAWDNVADLTAGDATVLTYWGWVGIKGEVGQFGYMIDQGTPVYNDAWTHATEQPVIDAAKPTGADTASRMKITIDLTGLTGEHTVHVLYKNANGDMVLLNAITVKLP